MDHLTLTLNQVEAAKHMAAATGLSWQQIWAWILQYGLPVVIQLLTILLPLLLAGKMTIAQAEAYAVAYFAAILAGKPPPPLPV